MVTHLYLCPNCFHALEAIEAVTTCEVCGHTPIVCKPGDPDDPCRKPLMDGDGDVLTRAPQWWIVRYKELAAQSTKGN